MLTSSAFLCFSPVVLKIISSRLTNILHEGPVVNSLLQLVNSATEVQKQPETIFNIKHSNKWKGLLTYSNRLQAGVGTQVGLLTSVTIHLVFFCYTLN